jgi:hypothetical protein
VTATFRVAKHPRRKQRQERAAARAEARAAMTEAERTAKDAETRDRHASVAFWDRQIAKVLGDA